MKTILNLLIILAVAALVAGGYYLIVNQTSLISASGEEGRQPPAMTNGTMPQRPEGLPEGGEHGASLGQGLLQVLITLAKLAGITALVLLADKGFDLVSQKRAAKPV